MERLRYFKNTINRLQVFGHGDRVVIGVSGGADSLALMHLFTAVRDDIGVVPYVVHVHHGIRGEEADADAAFVSASADQMSVAHRVLYADVPELARKHQLTVEEAARKARYTLLAEAADELGARVIAVAHNADDQAETVLMHLLRGAGLAGLRGMLPITPLSESHLLPTVGARGGTTFRHALPLQIIRPLLDMTRAEIEEYCKANELHPRTDSTNADTSYMRNRIRHEVMPMLESINPNLKRTLGRTSKILAADHEFIEDAINQAWADVVIESTLQRIRFDPVLMPTLPLTVRRGLIIRGMRLLDIDSLVNFDWVNDAARLISEDVTGGSRYIPLSTTTLVCHEDEISLIVDKNFVEPNFPQMGHAYGLTITGVGIYRMKNDRWLFTLRTYDGLREGAEWQAMIADRWSAVLNAELLSLPFLLRKRKRGDRFYPQGAKGSQKLSDFLINVKFPKMWRDSLPLLVNQDDEIVWVPGYRVDERFIVKAETQRVWIARFEKIKEG